MGIHCILYQCMGIPGILYQYILVYIYIGSPYYNTLFPYSSMGTEYGHPQYLLNTNIK